MPNRYTAREALRRLYLIYVRDVRHGVLNQRDIESVMRDVLDAFEPEYGPYSDPNPDRRVFFF